MQYMSRECVYANQNHANPIDTKQWRYGKRTEKLKAGAAIFIVVGLVLVVFAFCLPFLLPGGRLATTI